MELWKDVPGYGDKYQVSSLGRVRSKDRSVLRSDGRIVGIKGQPIKERTNANGYSEVQISDDGRNCIVRVHRLVAIAFIKNPNNLPEVNHKDENKCNNTVENLEWCTHKYNSSYGSRGRRIAEKNNKPILLEKDGVVSTFIGLKAAAEFLGVKIQSISYALTHQGKTKGYSVFRES